MRTNLLLLSLLITGCGYKEWRESDCFNGCSVSGEPQPGPAGPPGPAGKDGEDGEAGKPGIPGTGCTVTAAVGGAIISCADGTSAIVLDGAPGVDGINGTNGTNGIDGTNGVNGRDGLDGRDGIDGINGTNGTNGVDGINGTNGADGLNGTDGLDAPPTPYTVTEMVDPCGDESQFDEILLRLANNQLVAHFSSGALEFLTIIGPGNYTTTDGTGCTFTIHNDMTVTW